MKILCLAIQQKALMANKINEKEKSIVGFGTSLEHFK